MKKSTFFLLLLAIGGILSAQAVQAGDRLRVTVDSVTMYRNPPGQSLIMITNPQGAFTAVTRNTEITVWRVVLIRLVGRTDTWINVSFTGDGGRTVQGWVLYKVGNESASFARIQ